jgi:hypothetical protein
MVSPPLGDCAARLSHPFVDQTTPGVRRQIRGRTKIVKGIGTLERAARERLSGGRPPKLRASLAAAAAAGGGVAVLVYRLLRSGEDATGDD